MLFSKTNVNRVEWLNLVFENRNQSYGAYVLRKESGNYLLKALIISFALLIGLLILSSFKEKKKEVVIDNTFDPIKPNVIYVELVKNPIKKVEKQSSSKPESSQPIDDFKQVNYSGNIKPSNTPFAVDLPSTEELKVSVISSIEKDGKETGAGNNVLEGSDKGNSGLGNGEESNITYNFNLVEEMPEFPGGMDAWSKFLSKNLRYPSMAQEANVMGRVMVSFVVEKNGEITNLKVLKGIGAGCDEEAMRVIKKSPFWKPGIQNGKPVRVSYVMPIVFRLD